jgi:mannose-6-phosphate isomerase-like protein (cupin superfamily)
MNAPARNVSVADHSVAPPTHHEADGAPTWVTRASHLVTAITQAAAGTRLGVEANPDESMVLLPDCGARVTTAAGSREVPANSLLILPPGDSTLELLGPGWVLRAFTTRQQALAARAVNAADFTEPHADVAPMRDWPAPVGGWRLRVYDLEAALAEGEKTRVFRCSNLMINILRERQQARDVRALSPHSHTDFEQASVTLRGVHLHHLRWPWTPDMTTWRPDTALQVGAPSVTVIPPTVVHTTRNIGDGPALLIDLFAPPRLDFSLRAGLVRNADEYPLPGSAA